MKPVIRGLAVAVAAVSVAACVKTAWQVTYPGPENYSVGTTVLVAKDGTSYMAGSFGNAQALFVAAYNASGKKLWDRQLQGNGLVAVQYGRSLLLDNGQLFLRWNHIGNTYDDFATHLFSLNAATGEVLVDRVLEATNFSQTMKMGDDGTLYISSAWAGGVAAYDQTGDLLWQYALPPANGSMESELGQYHASAAVQPAAGGNSSQGWSHLVGSGNWFAVYENRVVMIANDSLIVLDGDGQVALEKSNAELGLDSATVLDVVAGGLLLIGSAQGAGVSLILNADLDEVQRSDLGIANVENALVSVQKNDVCIAIEDSEVQLIKLDAAGQPLWSQSVANPDGTRETFELIAGDDACFVTTFVTQTDGRVQTQTARYTGQGEPTHRFDLQDFASYGAVVHGKSVYQVGMTGEYDNSVTLATLNKQTRQ